MQGAVPLPQLGSSRVAFEEEQARVLEAPVARASRCNGGNRTRAVTDDGQPFLVRGL